jgi:hypothetical protein
MREIRYGLHSKSVLQQSSEHGDVRPEKEIVDFEVPDQIAAPPQRR